jgi:hypothetical protein
MAVHHQRPLKVLFSIALALLGVTWGILLLAALHADFHVGSFLRWPFTWPLLLASVLSALALALGWFNRPEYRESLWSLVLLQYLGLLAMWLPGFSFAWSAISSLI